MPTPVSQHWLALRFSHLPLEALGHSLEEQQPVAVIEHKQTLCINQASQRAGLKPTMPVATAALLADICFLDRAINLEKQALKSLVAMAYQYSPHMEVIQPYAGKSDCGVMIEVSRCLTLFKGFDALLETLLKDFRKIHHVFSLGISHTHYGAWLSSFNPSHDIVQTPVALKLADRERYLNQLKPLPITVLQECRAYSGQAIASDQDIENLHKTGFDTLSDILSHFTQQSLKGFKKRWRAEFITLLQDIFDTDTHTLQTRLFQKPVKTYTPEETFYDHCEFEFPHTNIEHIGHAMRKLLDNLDSYLQVRQITVQSIQWQLFDIYQNKATFVIHATESQHDGALLWQLSMIQLEAKGVSFEVDSLELICKQVNRTQHHNMSLNFESQNEHSVADEQDNALTLTLARLQARLGEHALYRMHYQDSYVPEKSFVKEPATAGSYNTAHPKKSHRDNIPEKLSDKTLEKIGPRPTWLFKNPLPIFNRQTHLYWRGKLELSHGPERIEGDWWDSPVTRDYFIAAREDGVRIWVYYDLQTKSWFAHGVFG